MQVSNFLDNLRQLLAELEALPIPTVAVIDGYALGGGAELALGCDLRVGGETTLSTMDIVNRLLQEIIPKLLYRRLSLALFQERAAPNASPGS